MKHSDLFVRTAASLDAMAALVREEVGLALEREVHGTSVSYVADVDGHRVALLLNRDDEPPMDRFDVDVEVDGHDDGERLAFTRAIFDKLAKLGTMELMLTDNLVEIDRFEPKPAAAAE